MSAKLKDPCGIEQTVWCLTVPLQADLGNPSWPRVSN